MAEDEIIPGEGDKLRFSGLFASLSRTLGRDQEGGRPSTCCTAPGNANYASTIEVKVPRIA